MTRAGLCCAYGRILGISLVLMAGFAGDANALPSFSDQTGDPCSACHVGAFGPQLTAHGRMFKLTGYSDGSRQRDLPLLSGMVEWSYEKTGKGQPGGAAPGYGDNNNAAFDQISLFLGGRIYDHLGIFSQTTYSGVPHHWSWDQTDLRYGREVDLGALDSVLGVSLNNNPTVSDPFNSTPAWGFPFAKSSLAPTPAAAPMIEGALAQRVVGTTAYGLFNDLVYAEAGAYRMLPQLNKHETLGVQPTDGPTVNGTAPYWRLALQRETSAYSAAFGTFGMSANVYPGNDHTSGTDHYGDYGLDSSFQWHASKRHVFSLNGAAIAEKATLGASTQLGNSSRDKSYLGSYHLNGSYYYDQTYGLTIGGFKTHGSTDGTAYAPASVSGSNNGKPDSTGYILQVDYTPFGKDDSWGSPWANLRFAVQYTGYTQFNGGSSNYDGNGRSAANNNTLWFLTWLAF
ncbi:MAG TPA: hypothetical protein VM661_12160 [Candidatus Sulfotelmatobacter sp.]|nr:hypothetical protein [Candidatus Sulfotelmatobacter sp.]